MGSWERDYSIRLLELVRLVFPGAGDKEKDITLRLMHGLVGALSKRCQNRSDLALMNL